MVVGATLLQWALWPVLKPLVYFCFYPVVVLAAMYADALTATLLAIVAVQFFAADGVGFVYRWPSDFLRDLMFLGFGLMVGQLARGRTSALHELRVERDKLRAVIENVDAGIGLIDAQGNTLSMNAAGLAIHGFGSEAEMFSMLGHYVQEFELRYPDGRVMPFEEWPSPRALRGEKVKGYDVRLCRRSTGSERYVRYSVIPVLARGKAELYVVTMADLTEGKRTEKVLADAISARDEFLSVASHELRTPLTSLKLQAQTRLRILMQGGKLAKESLSPEKLKGMFMRDDQQINRLARLIDDMLDISKIGRGKLKLSLEEFDLAELVREVCEHYRPQFDAAGSAFELTLGTSVVGRWDRHRIEQLVANLLTNAVKYGAGQPVAVSLRRAGGDRVELSVKDQGIGIARENQERIFQRYERAVASTEISGLGLGLYIAKEIVELHGGGIHLESELGRGARFVVDLPLRSEPRE